MRKFALLLTLFFSLFTLNSCEKDDICIAGDTPKLRIGFYNSNDTASAKEPTDLVIIGKDKTTTLSKIVPSDNTGYELLIPLNPSEDSSSYYLFRNASIVDGILSGEVELLTISYDLKAVYISKACGYIANYEQLQIDRELDQSWIQNIRIENSSITNENEVHVKIYH